MPVSKKQQACVNRYVKEKYDRINVTFPKGFKERLVEHKEKFHYNSVNEMIGIAVLNLIKKDIESIPVEKAKEPLDETDLLSEDSLRRLIESKLAGNLDNVE